MKKQKLVKTLFSIILIQLSLIMDTFGMNKPEKYLEIVIESEQASYYINFNDVDVFTEASDAPITQTIPVNHWALNGKNNLLISVNFKEKNPIDVSNQSKLIASLYLKIKDSTSEERHLISKFDLSPSSSTPEKIASSSLQNIETNSKTLKKDKSGDIVVGPWNQTAEDEWINFEQNIIIDLGLEKWAYLDADFIADLSLMSEEQFFELSDELFLQYEIIWKLFKENKTKELLDITALRSKELNNAFHLKKGSKEHDMEKSLSSAFTNSDLYLDKLIDKENAQLSILAYGKIVNIKVAGTIEPPIFYSHKQESFTRYYDFYFMKKNGNWIIIR